MAGMQFIAELLLISSGITQSWHRWSSSLLSDAPPALLSSPFFKFFSSSKIQSHPSPSHRLKGVGLAGSA